MKIQVNGQAWECSGDMNVLQLLHEFAMVADRVAVEVNQEILDKKNYQARFLSDGDRVEIISFVGGGAR